MTKGEEGKIFDIRERTYHFAGAVVRLVSQLPKDTAGYALGRQLVRAGTSIGANVEEASGSWSKKEFVSVMSIARREARETLFWLRVIRETGMAERPVLDAALTEADELVRILTAIVKRADAHS